MSKGAGTQISMFYDEVSTPESEISILSPDSDVIDDKVALHLELCM